VRALETIGVASLCGSLLAGCTTVPPLQVDPIAISDIVQRVKCEIAYAVPKPEPPWPTGRFQWMRTWTAKVDLTLKTEENSGITPSVGLIDPMKPATIPLIGSFQQNFTLGLGAGFNTTATRTEVLTFTVSLAELRKWKQAGNCNLPAGAGLYGNLGLQEWMLSALAPVEAGQLRVGRHPPPGGKSPPAPPTLPPTAGLVDPCTQLLNQYKVHAESYAREAASALENAVRNSKRDDIQATYDEAARVYGAADKAAEQAVIGKKEHDLRVQDDNCKPQKAVLDQLLADIQKIADGAKNAKDAVDKVLDGLPHDPPIDALSHSVNFVVALSGNVTPTWSLVRFKGLTGTFASGSHSNTHTLSIAMGSPAALPGEQNRQLNNLILLQALSPPKATQQ
jgi:hypothetical protein